MKHFLVPAFVAGLALIASSAAAQTEAVLTRGACGSTDVFVTLRSPNRPTDEEGVLVSVSRVGADLPDLVGENLGLSLLDSGSVVACGAVPAPSADPNRAEFEIVSESGAFPHGTAIIRLFVPGETTVILAVTGLEASAWSSPETSAQLSAEESAYVEYLQSTLTLMGDSAIRVSDLFADPRIGEDDWTLLVATELALWTVAYDDAVAMEPPSRFSEVHAVFTEMMALTDGAARDYIAGIDSFDVALIESGSLKLAQATDLIDDVNRALEEAR